MMKFVVLWVLVWHGMCRFSRHALSFGTNARILNFTASVSPNINDTDAQILRIIEPKANYNFINYNITIFYQNAVVPNEGTTESATAATAALTSVSTNASKTALTLASTTVSSTAWQKGYIVTNGIGAHKLYTTELTWSQARQICIEDGGDLAVISSDAEAQIMKKMANDSGLINPWIDFNSQLGKRHWVCVPTETNGSGYWFSWKEHNTYKKGTDYYVYDYNGVLKADTMCYTSRPFICKITTI